MIALEYLMNDCMHASTTYKMIKKSDEISVLCNNKLIIPSHGNTYHIHISRSSKFLLLSFLDYIIVVSLESTTLNHTRIEMMNSVK